MIARCESEDECVEMIAASPNLTEEEKHLWLAIFLMMRRMRDAGTKRDDRLQEHFEAEDARWAKLDPLLALAPHIPEIIAASHDRKWWRRARKYLVAVGTAAAGIVAWLIHAWHSLFGGTGKL